MNQINPTIFKISTGRNEGYDESRENKRNINFIVPVENKYHI